MPISNISIQNFRLLLDVKLTFSDDLNIFYGLNASGKTSILEALFFLSRGKSFKQPISTKLINFSSKEFIIFSQLNNSIPIGISKSVADKLKIKFNNKFITSSFTLSKNIILQILNPDSFLLIDYSPSIRRKFLDWLVFHVKHDLFILWKRYRVILKNRNCALKNKLSVNEIKIWDKELIKISQVISNDRLKFIEILNINFKKYKKKYLFNYNIFFEFYPGWNNKDNNYKNILENNFIKDFKYGFTQFGIHKADFQIKIEINNKIYNIKDILSNGQKKYISMIIYILQMVILLENKKDVDIKPVLLIDDITSELDIQHSSLLIDFIKNLDIQVFITLLESDDYKKLIYNLKNSSSEKKRNLKVFHVEQGIIKEEIKYTEDYN